MGQPVGFGTRTVLSWKVSTASAVREAITGGSSAHLVVGSSEEGAVSVASAAGVPPPESVSTLLMTSVKIMIKNWGKQTRNNSFLLCTSITAFLRNIRAGTHS